MAEEDGVEPLLRSRGGSGRMKASAAAVVGFVLLAACCVIFIVSTHRPSASELLYAGYERLALPRTEDINSDVETKEKVLARIRSQIAKEKDHLREMHAQENILRSKHAQVQSQVERLLRSSRSSARDIQHIRDRYVHRAERMEHQYLKEREELQDQRDMSLRRRNQLKDKITRLASELSTAYARVQYYNTQDEDAEKGVEEMEARAREERDKADKRLEELEVARRETNEKLVQEAQSVADRKVAKIVAEQRAHALRKASRTKADFADAQAQYIEQSASAKTETAIAEEAREAVEKAEEQHELLEKELKEEKEEYHHQRDRILDLKSKSEIAEDHANHLERRTDIAEEELEDLKTKEEETVEKSQDAIDLVESAESTAALAKTQEKVVEGRAEVDKAEAKEQIARARNAVHESNKKLEESEAESKHLLNRREKALLDEVFAEGSVKTGDHKLELARRRSSIVKQQAHLASTDANDKKKTAEGLLHSVGALAALARQAARAAEKARIKAEHAAGIVPARAVWQGESEGEETEEVEKERSALEHPRTHKEHEHKEPEEEEEDKEDKEDEDFGGSFIHPPGH